MENLSSLSMNTMENKVQYIISQQPVPYQTALDFMQKHVAEMQEGKAHQLLWFLQHQEVYTAGTSANENELLDPNKFPVFQTGRGGKYTYHGPGQRVVYLMLNLKKIYNNSPDLKDFIKKLELWVIQSLNVIGINAYIIDGKVGVWVQNKEGQEEKIAAIGIRVQKWISFHGIAINVSTNLDDYKGIIPCGIRDKGVTSTTKQGSLLTLSEFDEILIQEFSKLFGLELIEGSISL